MQLEGSVFGVLMLQLKPQLEKVLNLPQASLIPLMAGWLDGWLGGSVIDLS